MNPTAEAVFATRNGLRVFEDRRRGKSAGAAEGWASEVAVWVRCAALCARRNVTAWAAPDANLGWPNHRREEAAIWKARAAAVWGGLATRPVCHPKKAAAEAVQKEAFASAAACDPRREARGPGPRRSQTVHRALLCLSRAQSSAKSKSAFAERKEAVVCVLKLVSCAPCRRVFATM